jgi:multiple sugar transport system substrate-binding protein
MMTDTLYSRRHLLRGLGAIGGAAAAAPLLAACGSSGGSAKVGKPGAATLNVWMVSEPSRTWIQDQMVSTFRQQNPEIKLNITKTDFTTYYQKLATSVAGGTTPDVFMMSGAYFYQAAHLGMLHQLDDLMKADHISLSDYLAEPSGEDVTFQGKTYGIPGEIDVIGLAYNKDLFDAAGTAYPTADWTWDDLLAAAQKLTRTVNGKEQYGFYSWNSSQEMWGELVLQNGGQFLNDNLTEGALQSPEAIAGIQFAVDLIHKHKVSPSSQGVSSLPGYLQSGGNPFLTGLIGMKFQGNYELELLSQIKTFHWDVVSMPKSVKHTGLGWYQSWVMSSQTKHPAEAWQLLKFLVTDGQTITASAPGRGLTPARKSAAQSPDFVRTAPPHITAWVDAWQQHGSFGFHPGWFQYQNAYSSALDKAFAGTTSVKAAIDGATAQVNSALKQYAWFSKSLVSNG